MFTGDHTDFSIIIPTRDRQGPLAVCLKGITHLAYPRSDFEVIVVDDGSKTSLEPVIDPFRHFLDLTLLTQPSAGPASARNCGAEKARGRFLVFIDDDCIPSPDWLQKLAAALESAPNRVIGGRTINTISGNPFSTASQLLISYLYKYYNANPNDARFLASNNISILADDFRALGGFDPSYPRAAAEDRDLCDRLRLYGYRMTYAADAVVYHAHALTPSTFWRQHFNYGRGAARFRVVRAQRGQGGVKLEPLRFYMHLLCYPFVERIGWQAPLLAALMLVSQAANALGYFWELASKQHTPSRQ